MAANDLSTCEDQVWAIITANKDNLTALQLINAPSWVSASQFRGTMAIIQSCIVTLIACIYTAIHLNVPEKTDWWSLLLTKARWVSLALIAPEIVVLSAARQFLKALRLRNQIK